MITCIHMTYFAAAIEQRDDEDLADKPLVIGGPPWENRPLFAYSQHAAQRGVIPGMSLRRAHFLSPNSHFLPTAHPRYREDADNISELLRDFGDRVEAEHLWDTAKKRAYDTISARQLPARYLLDLEGLPLTEAIPFIRELGQTVRHETHLAPSIGIARDRFTAQVAATLARPNHALPVDVGAEAGFLWNRPVQLLPLQREALRRLYLLGIETLGQLAALPSHALPTQLGYETAMLIRKSIKPIQQIPNPTATSGILPLAPIPTISVSRRLEGGERNQLALLALLRQLAIELAADLQATSRAGNELQLWWQTERSEGKLAQPLRQPSCDPQQFTVVAAELLQKATLAEPVTHIALQLNGIQPANARQLGLFEVAERGKQALRELTTKYGGGCFNRPVLDNPQHPLPERRFQLQPLFAL